MYRSLTETNSIWQKEGYGTAFPRLERPAEADICVVGAGIAGLTTGYLLQKEGKSVVILDAWGLAAGETGRTTAHLSNVLDEGFDNLLSLFGEADAQLAVRSHGAAIDRIEAIVKEEKIDCDFERLDGFLAAPDAHQQQEMEKEKNAVFKLGFADCEYLNAVPIPGVEMGPVLKFPRQATFNIAKYMSALAEAFERLGGRIFIGARAIKVTGGENACVLTQEGVQVKTQAVVVATNTPINDWVKMHTKQAAYRSYVVGYKIPKNAYPPFLLWDMEDPYHYVRIVRGDGENDMLIAGGEDHKTGQENDAERRYRRLNDWTRRYFKNLGPVSWRWSGQIMEPVDGLGFIGRNPMDKDNVYIITGDSGHGITHSTIAGMLITDLIQGRQNPWENLYDPVRKSVKSAGTYLRENANFLGCMVSDWAEPGGVESVENIPPGEGAILRKGLSKIAVYKDEKGQLTECSAVCTHLKCVVQWNSGEKSWDCPCHGSRFDPHGRVLNGPAFKPLEEHLEASAGKAPGRRAALQEQLPGGK